MEWWPRRQVCSMSNDSHKNAWISRMSSQDVHGLGPPVLSIKQPTVVDPYNPLAAPSSSILPPLGSIIACLSIINMIPIEALEVQGPTVHSHRRPFFWTGLPCRGPVPCEAWTSPMPSDSSKSWIRIPLVPSTPGSFARKPRFTRRIATDKSCGPEDGETKRR